MDKFTFYKNRVETALKKYESTRALRDTASSGLYETIMREAAPFKKGHFTMAVIGKMSSGKSTFVNALLGNRSLLPTAYEQTTCTLTEIEYGDSVQIQVIYGSGRSKTFTDTRELLKTAAIPEKYQHLPINFINKLILANKSESEIIKGKEKLDELQGENVDVNLLRDYIRTHSNDKDNIPTRVLIKYPLPESYHGWKIVDTPGVSALGGIEKETRDFLNGKNEFGYNNVDAIVFVHSSKYPIEDKEFHDFVNQTFLYLTPEARKRVFFVITHAANPDFMDAKDTYMKSAKKIFVEGCKIPESRLMCVDSICSLFHQYAKKCSTPILSLKKADVPQDWDERTWATAMNVKAAILQGLLDSGRDLVNENVLLLLDKLSGIENLRARLDAFITSEKSASYCRLMKYINDDLSSMLNDLRQKKNILESSIGNQSLDVLKSKMIAEQKKLSESRNTFNGILTKVRNDYSKKSLSNRFDRFTTDMRRLRGWSSIKEIQLEAGNIMSEVESTKSTILTEVSATLEKLWDKNCSASGVVLPMIDFRTIASKAEQDNTYTTGGDIIGYQKKTVKRQTVGGSIKRFFGSIFGNDSWGYDEVDDYSRPIRSKVETHTNEVKAAQEFANKVYSEFSAGITSFVDGLYKHIFTIGDSAKKEADKQIQMQQDSYSELVKRNQTLENQKNTISQFESKIKSLQTAIVEITELSHDR